MIQSWAAAVGCNCSAGPEKMLGWISAMKPYATVLAEFKAAYENMIAAEKKFREIINREAL